MITPDENRLVFELLGGNGPQSTEAHPLWAFIATQRGIGLSVAELCALADFDVADGPMMAAWRVAFNGQLQTEVRYRVTGEVTSLVRKRGKSGDFDLMTFVERLIGEDSFVVAETTSTFVFPRKAR